MPSQYPTNAYAAGHRELAAAELAYKAIRLECKRYDISIALWNLEKYTTCESMSQRIKAVNMYATDIHASLRKRKEELEQEIWDIRKRYDIPEPTLDD